MRGVFLQVGRKSREPDPGLSGSVPRRLVALNTWLGTSIPAQGFRSMLGTRVWPEMLVWSFKFSTCDLTLIKP